MFNKVLIANRGVAAVRIARTLRELGIKSVGLRTDAELQAKYFSVFDEVRDLGAGTVAQTYLNKELILALALDAEVQAIHPGYGFLSENAEFAQAVQEAGLSFIGPDAETIESFGMKHTARQLALNAGLTMLPGTSLLVDVEEAVIAAREIGYPVILKSTAGGGGIGMQRCDDETQLLANYASVAALAEANFSSGGLFLEKCLDAPRHVEVQIFGDGQGDVLVLGDRDCSMQRRNQKVVEECPAPNIPDRVRNQMHVQAAALARSIDYASAGTVEFLYDPELQQVYFLEVNTRLQVEHAVTEMVWRIDLVAWMIRLAAGELEPLGDVRITPAGHAIQARWYAEDPYLDFQPTPGQVDLTQDTAVRFETWVEGRTQVSHQFDPMLANVICHAENRQAAIEQLDSALAQMQVYGIATNQTYLRQLLKLEAFVAENMSTRLLASMSYKPREIEILAAGLETTVQTYPGRQGLWEVGVPPSGPMDDLSFRAGNRLLGNDEGAAGLEILFQGPTLKFRHDTTVVVTGGVVSLELGGRSAATGQPLSILAGQTLKIGQIETGMRCYLLVAGGLDVKQELGAGATFTLGQIGGHSGRALQVGDVLRWHEQQSPINTPAPLVLPDLQARTTIRMLLGPHAAPDFFTQSDIQTIFSSTWRVHHNSSRTGVRFVGPQPEWARADGGEAGLHPSNIHDNAYAFGALDFTGDMPVVLGPDGPSLGGFVCPAVVINADRWKLGQLQPADTVQFELVSVAQAEQALQQQQLYLAGERAVNAEVVDSSDPHTTPVLWQSQEPANVVARRAGQEWILLEFGQPELNITTRLQVHRLMQLLRQSALPGLIEMTPGVRSLQIRFDPAIWAVNKLLDALQESVREAVQVTQAKVSSRVVHMPLSWDDPACQQAIDRYVSSVRADAPWCPDNIEFIRRINGLPDKQAVKDIVFDASYLVLGLGDVYLGAPVATPLDPRHRLVTTKYNPARTWTAENSVGIGGSYMCIYGMEGPGGYQFVGRTIPVWRTGGFALAQGNSWLLDHFDQIRFFPVDAQQLLELRDATRHGAYLPDIEEAELDIAGYQQTLTEQTDSIEQFVSMRTGAFQAEMERWRAAGLDKFVAQESTVSSATGGEFSDGHVVESPMAASVWRVKGQLGQHTSADTEILLLEAMKSEFSIKTPVAGRVEFLVKEGQVVEPGQPLAIIH